MKTPKKFREAFFIATCVASFPARLGAELPRVPFSGSYGATSGAGSVTGWERLGGDNPATLGAPGWTASAAGYAPFGLEDVSVMELGAARDADRWGASFGVRTLSAGQKGGGIAVSLVRGGLAARLGEHWSGGGALRFGLGSAAGRDGGIGGGLGVLWRPKPFASLGAAWEEGLLGLGFDCGTGLGGGVSWRYSVERFFGEEGEFRHGLGVRLHPLLSVYAGLAPARRTASLGVRFGAGSWEGFGALRRHAALGGTPVQGVRWTREKEGSARDARLSGSMIPRAWPP